MCRAPESGKKSRLAKSLADKHRETLILIESNYLFEEDIEAACLDLPKIETQMKKRLSW